MMDEQWVPKSKEELISAIEREWSVLMAVADQLTPEQMTQPDKGGWSPKDNLAHLGEWMNVLMGHHMDQRPASEVMGIPEEVTKDWDMEEINPVLFKRNRDRSIDEVLSWLKDVYVTLHARLESTSFDDLMKPRHADDPEKRPLLLWVLGDTTEHFAEHREVIERSLK
jgi:hypothetical protein